MPCVLDEPVAASGLGVAARGTPVVWALEEWMIFASRNAELMAVQCPREQGCDDEREGIAAELS